MTTSLSTGSRARTRDVAGVVRFIWTHPANRSRRVRQLLRAVAFQIRARALRRPTLAPLGTQSRLWVELHSHAASAALYANPPDWFEMHTWRAHLRPGDLFVDIGANVGVYTLWAAEAGAHVIAVEPDPYALRCLEENLALNAYEVEILPVALGAEPGRAHLTQGLASRNHLIQAGCRPSDIEIPVSTLDEVVGDRYVAGVKIDVEGAERLVLEGARHALEEQRIGLLQLEWNRRSVDVLGQDRAPVAELLASFGYELLRPAPPDGVLRPITDVGYGPDVFARPRRT